MSYRVFPAFSPLFSSVYADKMSRLLVLRVRETLLLVFAVTLEWAQTAPTCTSTYQNPCRCDGDGFFIDISHFLTFPQKHIPDIVQPGKYVYAYSPCVPIDCSITGANDADSHVCQNEEEYGTQYFSLGRNVAANWTITSMSPLTFTITYTGGDPANNVNRQSVVKFTRSTGTPSMAFINEDDANFTFIFELSGNTVKTDGGGGGGSSCVSVPSGSNTNFCSCYGDGFNINISNYLNFPEKNIPAPGQDYSFFYSPCVPIACGPGVAADSFVCQYESNTQYYSLGRVVDRIWTVNSMDPLTFTIRYTGGDIAGDLARQTNVTFSYGVGAPILTFISQKALSFNFQLTGNEVSGEHTHSCVTSSTHGPDKNLCRCDGDGFYIDISDYFSFPIKGIPDPTNPGKYTYQYSPCEPIACGSGGYADSFMCQKEETGGMFFFSLGRKLVANWTITSMSPLIFSIQYTGGDTPPLSTTHRQTFVKFSQSRYTPSIVFVDEEDTTLTYNFQVVGNVVHVVSGSSGSSCAGLELPAIIGIVCGTAFGLSLLFCLLIIITAKFLSVLRKKRQGYTYHPLSQDIEEENK